MRKKNEKANSCSIVEALLTIIVYSTTEFQITMLIKAFCKSRNQFTRHGAKFILSGTLAPSNHSNMLALLGLELPFWPIRELNCHPVKETNDSHSSNPTLTVIIPKFIFRLFRILDSHCVIVQLFTFSSLAIPGNPILEAYKTKSLLIQTTENP